ncbi:MAG: agmatinase family protein [Phycisphaerales bacterium]|nr:agmatinase family protein [Phycisphaerales bacterium]
MSHVAFDPDAAATPGSGIYGLPFDESASRVVLLPVAFDATTSYRPGTAGGPSAILEASMQVDLFDSRFGRVYEQGIWMKDEDPRIAAWNREASELARPIVEAGGIGNFSVPLSKINAICQALDEFVYEETKSVLRAGKVPGLIGGEHSTPFGAIRACAEANPGMGVLHVDAHMDLRDAFEGFAWSHASIMHNVLNRVKGLGKFVQVGIRDFGKREMKFAELHKVDVYLDIDLAEEMLNGAAWRDLCAKMIEPLPEKVYVSFDIDALDPSLCPHTGTPVPGGLSFAQAALLLETLWRSGRRAVGFDLVEVAPGTVEGEPEWDANVGARLLYKLCGCVQERVG